MRDAYAKPSSWQKERRTHLRALLLKYTSILHEANENDLLPLKTMEDKCSGINPAIDDQNFSNQYGPDQPWDRPSFVEWQAGMRVRPKRKSSNTSRATAIPESKPEPATTIPDFKPEPATTIPDFKPEPATTIPDLIPEPAPRTDSRAPDFDGPPSYDYARRQSCGGDSVLSADIEPAGAPPAPPPLPTSLTVPSGLEGTAFARMATMSQSSNEDVVDEDAEWGSREWDEPPKEFDPLSTVVLRLAKAVYDYDGQEDDELNFKEDQILEVYAEEDDDGWCRGNIRNGTQAGVFLFPSAYTEPYEE